MLNRHFGLSRRPSSAGISNSAGALGGKYAHANSNLFPLLPSGSMRDQASGPPLKRFNTSDTFRDVIAAGFVLLFVLSVALAFVGGVFLCFFCQF